MSKVSQKATAALVAFEDTVTTLVFAALLSMEWRNTMANLNHHTCWPVLQLATVGIAWDR